jgi:hypothetical protein
MRHSIPQDDGPKRRWPRIVGRASFRIENRCSRSQSAARTMPMGRAVVNPGEGVVGRVRRLRGSYARARPRQPSSGYGWPAVEAGRPLSRGAIMGE